MVKDFDSEMYCIAWLRCWHTGGADRPCQFSHNLFVPLDAEVRRTMEIMDVK